MGYNTMLDSTTIHYEWDPTKYTPGDMNNDGEVTILDVLALLKAVAGITDKPAHADVNGDGDVTILDVLTLLKFVAGISGTTIY